MIPLARRVPPGEPSPALPISWKNVAVGVGLSLFVFPGMGHRHVGRHWAGWIILVSFLAIFLCLGFSLHAFVQKNIQPLTQGQPVTLPLLMANIKNSLGEATEVHGYLRLLVVLYVAAPMELVLAVLFGWAPVSTPPSSPSTPPGVDPTPGH